jgi:hypothetical protein
MNWLLHAWYAISGANDEGGPVYGSWSGIAGATACFAWVPASIVIYRHHNCEVHHCWRLGRHQTAAGHRVCRPHHPEPPLTAVAVTAAHKAAL